jgi:hypothetical protein
MLGLKGRQDKFRLQFPKDFLLPEIEEKYTKVLTEKHSFIVSPIEFLNESIQGVQILGFTGASMQQQQSNIGAASTANQNTRKLTMMHTFNDQTYRSEKNPVALIDKTINIIFRHSLGFINYFMLFENFFTQYARGTSYDDLIKQISIDIMNEQGEIYARVFLTGPIIDAMDMLDLSYTQPIAQSQTFQVTFKYSNIEFQFISEDEENEENN